MVKRSGMTGQGAKYGRKDNGQSKRTVGVPASVPLGMQKHLFLAHIKAK
jgi:hypothetical protein